MVPEEGTMDIVMAQRRGKAIRTEVVTARSQRSRKMWGIHRQNDQDLMTLLKEWWGKKGIKCNLSVSSSGTWVMASIIAWKAGTLITVGFAVGTIAVENWNDFAGYWLHLFTPQRRIRSFWTKRVGLKIEINYRSWLLDHVIRNYKLSLIILKRKQVDIRLDSRAWYSNRVTIEGSCKCGSSFPFNSSSWCCWDDYSYIL